MSKTIWLKKLAISLFNQEDSPLALSYRYLKRLSESDEGILYLKEPNAEGFAILLHKDTASIFSLEADKFIYYHKIYDQIKEKQSMLKLDADLIYPLSSHKAACFGYILLKQGGQENEKLEEAVLSFSELVYSELYGGFLSSNQPCLMEVKDVCLRYNTSEQKNVVDHVSLKVNKGELTIIMGKSGCGKSSLLNIMAGLLSPNSGEVIWNNKDICQMKEKEKTTFRRDELGYIFQNYNLIKELTAGENIALAAALSKNSLSVKEALALVSLEEFEHYYPSQMSGGMQQRVAIARALVKNASILLCDEPTGALDSENAKTVMTILQNIAHEKQIPVVVVSHNADYAILADHYILLKDGWILEEYYNHFAYRATEVL